MSYTSGGGDGRPSKARWSELLLQHRHSPTFRRRRKIIGLALLALLLCSALAVALGFSGDDGADESGEIRDGVEVGGVDVSGMNRAEAREALQAEASRSLSEIRFGDGAGSVSGESLGIQLDARESVQRAYESGGERGFGSQALASLGGSSSGSSEIPAAVSFDRAAAEDAISGLSGGVAREPADASYEVSGGQVEAVAGEPGQELAVQKTLGNFEESLASLNGQVPVATNSVAPQTTVEELRGDMGSVEKLGEFETDYRYSDSEARKENLEISAGAVNGTVIESGEVFSMNDHIAGLDYREAKVFADGGETSALGGGLCQVTSTVYMAAQYAGLEIVERTPHYAVLPYIRPGFDATVWFGGQGISELDMKFRNTTDSSILVREYITDNGILKAEIWGQPTGKEVQMRSEQDFKDTSRGIKWSTYKTVREDGEVTREGLLYEDLYSFPPPESEGDEGYNEVRVGGWSG